MAAPTISKGAVLPTAGKRLAEFLHESKGYDRLGYIPHHLQRATKTTLITNRLQCLDSPQTPHNLSEFSPCTSVWQGIPALLQIRNETRSWKIKWAVCSVNRMSLRWRTETNCPETLASSSGPRASPFRLSIPHCVALPLSLGSTTEQLKPASVRSRFAVTAPEGGSKG